MNSWQELLELHGWDGAPSVPSGKRPVRFTVAEYSDEPGNDVSPRFEMSHGHIQYADEEWYLGWAVVDNDRTKVSIKGRDMTGRRVVVRMMEFTKEAKSIERPQVELLLNRRKIFQLDFWTSNASDLS